MAEIIRIEGGEDLVELVDTQGHALIQTGQGDFMVIVSPSEYRRLLACQQEVASLHQFQDVGTVH